MVTAKPLSPADGWTKHATLRNGTKVLLRPIQPTDEGLWVEMISKCSAKTIHLREKLRQLLGSDHKRAISHTPTDQTPEESLKTPHGPQSA